MTLRNKTLLIIGMTIVIMILILSISSRTIVLSSFVELEEQHVRQNMKRVLSALFDEFSVLDTMVSDWASWDDTYNFIEDVNEDYIQSNLVDETFTTSRLNSMLFINPSGQLVFGKAFDLQNENEIPVPQRFQNNLADHTFLWEHPDPESSTVGFLPLLDSPALFVSRPILTSKDEGPIRGALIMGRYLNSGEIDRLSKITHVSISLRRFDDSQMPPDFQKARLSLLGNVPIFIQTLSPESIAGYCLLEDMSGNPYLILRVDCPREIYPQGQRSVRYFVFLLLGTSLFLGGGILVFLEKTVLSRLARLSTRANDIAINRDLSMRISVAGQDELSNLAGEINRMLTALEQSQKELRKKSEERYRSLVEISPDAIILIDLRGKVTMANQRTAELFGFEHIEEFVGQEAFGFTAPEDRKRAMKNAHKTLETGSTMDIEYSMLKHDGTRFVAELSTSVITDAENKPIAFIEVLRDITERKRTEEAIVRAKREWEWTFDAVPDLIAILNDQHQIMRLNRAMADTLGLTPQEAVGLKCHKLVHGTESPPPFCPHTQSLLDGKTHTEERYESHLGRSFLVTVSPLHDPEGRFIGSVHVAHDFTDRKQAEEALKESEERFRALAENAPFGISIMKPDKSFEYFNPKFTEIFDYTRDDLPDKETWFQKAYPDEEYRHNVISTWQRDFIENQKDREILSRVFVVRCKHGQDKIIRFRPVILPGESQFLTYEDITTQTKAEEALHNLNEELELRVEARTVELQETNRVLQESLAMLQRTQAQLVQSEKMAALGALVAGVAHEINTPIGVGVTASSYLEEKSREIDQLYHKGHMKRLDLENYLHIARESSTMILRNLQRAAQQIQGFKQVAVDQSTEEKRTFKLKTYIDKVLLSLHPKIKKTTHSLIVNCPEDLELMSYPGAFSQVITNLVINSLIHGFERKEQGQIVLNVSTTNQTLWIRYSDNGKGMTHEERSRIFEPFYTTKRGQGGTGLGLHIVYNLVTQRLNGHIECESVLGEGTIFTIHIPMEDQENA